MRLGISAAAFTIAVCLVFVALNPVLLAHIDDGNFSEGDVFTPSNGSYDFGAFSMNSSHTKNFTAKHIEPGHVLLVDETGDKVINVIRFNQMIYSKKLSQKAFIDRELLKTGWTVDGVEVHEIEFSSNDNLYSACKKDIKSDTMIYIATPSDKETADMVNSLTFTS